ncbi:MAG TPA: tripartite tricarboxylate transporter substrate-binding protein [Xanthobacteraceae bacterium]|nr:tripartite tricarboxylate transporter substrate-binding protein [Xanthobacteraceae bacterium]
MRRAAVAIGATFAWALLATSACADPVADFYRGRNVAMVVGYSAAGGYDTYARVVARHLGDHIPGHPTILPQNMEGAGSLRAANWLYAAAPKDGSVIGMVSRGMAMEPLIGRSHASFDSRKLAWLGSGTNEVSTCVTGHASAVKTWADALTKPFTVGGEGSGSDPDVFATIMRNVFGVKLRLVSGYPGTAELTLAIERGEIDGRCGWSYSSLKQQHSDWVASKQVNILVQLALTRSPELPDVPLIADLATTDRQRQILRLVFSRQAMARPFLAPPGIPAERKQALRAAFDATMKDPAFLAEAKQRGLEVNPVSGAEIDKLIEELYQTPADVIAEVRASIAPGAN